MADHTPNYAHTARVVGSGPTGRKLYDFHFVNDATPNAAATYLNNVFTAALPFLYKGYAFKSWFWRPSGAVDFVYKGELNLKADENAPIIPDDARDVRWSFVGQSEGAIRVIVYFKGLTIVRHPRNRVEAEESIGVLAIWSALGSSEIVAGADGQKANWYPYANWKGNDRDVKDERLNGLGQ